MLGAERGKPAITATEFSGRLAAALARASGTHLVLTRKRNGLLARVLVEIEAQRSELALALDAVRRGVLRGEARAQLHDERFPARWAVVPAAGVRREHRRVRGGNPTHDRVHVPVAHGGGTLSISLGFAGRIAQNAHA